MIEKQQTQSEWDLYYKKQQQKKAQTQTSQNPSIAS